MGAQLQRVLVGIAFLSNCLAMASSVHGMDSHGSVAATCSFEVSPPSLTIPADGGPVLVSVVTADSCVWAATSLASWIELTSAALVLGSGEAAFEVTPFDSDVSRSAWLVVAGVGIPVTQEPVPCLEEPPRAEITISPRPGVIGETVAFSDTGQGHRDRRQWLVYDGDAVVANSSEAGFEHIFDDPGIYGVRLEVESCAGSDTASSNLLVVDPTAPVDAWAVVVPSVVRYQDLDGRTWASDVWVHNPCPDEMTLEIVFLPQDQDNSSGILRAMTVDLAGRATAELTGVVDLLPGMGSGPAKGALRIQPIHSGGCLPVVSSRTSGLAPEGAGSHRLPAVQVGIPCALETHLPGLLNDDRHRSTLLVLNMGDAVAEVSAEALGPDGTRLGKLATGALQPWSSHQVEDVAELFRLGSGHPPFGIRVAADVDTVTAVAAVVDRTTGDPASVVEHGCSHGVTYVPGVAHAAGLQDSQWRTDVVIYNPGPESCSARVTYVPDDPASDRYFVEFSGFPPGRQHVFEDIAGFLAGDRESRGFLRVVGLDDGPVPRLAVRTYSLAVDGGSFGQGVPSLGDNELLHVGERGVLPGISDAPDDVEGSRTNLGVINTSRSEPLRLRLTLFTPDGSISAEGTYPVLPPDSSMQLPLRQLLDLEMSEATGALEVTIASGGPAGVYAAIVDNRTQDAIVVSPTLLPGDLGDTR